LIALLKAPLKLTAEEVHSNIKREDGTSSFLETHVWPVTLDVIKHYLTTTQYLTTLQITSAILHDVMEDNDRILDLYTSHAYGFDAYFRHRFGEYVYTIADTLKTKLDSVIIVLFSQIQNMIQK
jgi:hypothetical protein